MAGGGDVLAGDYSGVAIYMHGRYLGMFRCRWEVGGWQWKQSDDFFFWRPVGSVELLRAPQNTILYLWGNPPARELPIFFC
jgi:hypothetical protein